VSDTVNGFIVVLDKEYKDDAVQATINAIKQIKGVIKVTPNVVDARDHIAAARIKQELITKMFNVLTDKEAKPSD